MSLLIFPDGTEQIFTGEIPAGYAVKKMVVGKGHVRYFHLKRPLWPRLKQKLVNLLVRIGDWAHDYQPEKDREFE